MNIPEQLRAAAQVIREKGWIQHNYEDGYGVCSIKALWDATPDADEEPAERYLTRVIGYRSVASWNDVPERTKEQVLQAFEDAALMAELDQIAAEQQQIQATPVAPVPVEA